MRHIEQIPSLDTPEPVEQWDGRRLVIVREDRLEEDTQPIDVEEEAPTELRHWQLFSAGYNWILTNFKCSRCGHNMHLNTGDWKRIIPIKPTANINDRDSEDHLSHMYLTEIFCRHCGNLEMHKLICKQDIEWYELDCDPTGESRCWWNPSNE